MILLDEDKAILAHIVIDPQRWADHAAATIGDKSVRSKIDKYRESYLSEKDMAGYKNRKQREVDAIIKKYKVPPKKAELLVLQEAKVI